MSTLKRGAADPASVPVIMCLWNRPERIDAILRQLDRQHRPVRLLLWNNAPAKARHYRERVASFTPSGSLTEVALYTSRLNVGGLARFFIARKLWQAGARGSFIMLDDDEDIRPEFVDDLLASAGPHVIAGFWAWKMKNDYWARTPALPGEIASYVGTGGSVCDLDIVSDPAFFTTLPRYYAFLEDLWMCGFARRRGWRLVKADVQIDFVLDETNQHHELGALKGEFYRYLRLTDPD
ncbi:hypothetical protein [Gryllotalpicola protaetiae]|uniref:hypothetical protein n=1 Tax=Gryllotalpicola protaetiae TaxID=2419771 RepID=UPI0013C4CCDA|nr:hypothetical protein [Gryllotalpicola protaetiae]